MSQTRDELVDTEYQIVRKAPKGFILRDSCGNLELWVEKDDYAGYVIVLEGKGHEFVCTVKE